MAFACALLLCGGAGGQETSDSLPGPDARSPALEIAIDSSAEAGIDEVSGLSFTPYPVNESINLGFVLSPIWVRLQFNQPATDPVEPRVVMLGPRQLLEAAMFHYVDGALLRSVRLDNETRFSDRPIPHRRPAFEIDAVPGQHTIYLRILSNAGFVLTPKLMSEAEFFGEMSVSDQLLAFFYGALFIFLLYNAVVYISSRDLLHLANLLVIVTLLGFQLVSTGIAYQYLWPENPEYTSTALRITIALFSASLGLFTLVMFRGKYWPRQLAMLNNLGIAGNLLLTVFPLFQVLPVLAFITISICPLVSAYVAIEILRRRYAESYFFAITWIAFTIGFGIGLLRTIGWLPYTAYTANVGLITMLIAIAVLSVGIASKIRGDRVARQAAEETSKVKAAFLANMSHEIRTPINAIVGFIDLVQDTELSREQRVYLEKARGSSNILLTIVNDILDYSKIEAGKMEVESRPFDVEKLCLSVLDLLERAAENKSLELKFSFDKQIPQFLIGDSLRIGQVLTNLLGNAVKFTDEGSVTLTVRLVLNSESKCALEFSVRDTGIGISTEEQDRLFQPFSQANSSTTRTYGGTGLGLSISTRILELMQSSLVLTSSPGEGSEFHFVLELPHVIDIREIEEPAPVSREQAGDADRIGAWEGARVLLVEDNKVNQLLAKSLLLKGNMEVDVAENGIEALQILENNRYDLVLMDIQMPEMDGLEATRRIRSMPEYEDLPIIAMTANAMERDRDECLGAGMNDYLPKPIVKETLLTMIGNWRH
jgi:signal transduction histidine kinase